LGEIICLVDDCRADRRAGRGQTRTTRRRGVCDELDRPLGSDETDVVSERAWRGCSGAAREMSLDDEIIEARFS
jgi:hypothetical protein